LADFESDEDVSEGLVDPLEDLGHDVLTARNLLAKGIKDPAQLSLATALGRIFVTHNGDDYVMLQFAWRRWANEWDVQPRPRHAGILIIPQSPQLPTAQAAREIDAVVRQQPDLANRVYAWRPRRGWERLG